MFIIMNRSVSEPFLKYPGKAAAREGAVLDNACHPSAGTLVQSNGRCTGAHLVPFP